MKKIIAAVITVVILLFTLISCAPMHEHTWRESWSGDLDRHWHYCSHENCLKRADEAEHSWDEGVIAAMPTPVIAGVKKFTCTVCGAIRTESYEWEE